MEVLVLDDVLNELADKLGIYGTCPNDNGCDSNEKCICRNGFMIEFEDKIRTAIENEKRLDELKIKYPTNGKATGNG